MSLYFISLQTRGTIDELVLDYVGNNKITV